MVDVASLRFDVIFKKAFGQPDVFCEFVRDVLGINIQVSQVIQDYRYTEPVGFVDIKYDLFAEDLDNRVIVEVQHVQEIDFFDRFFYYHIIGIIQQVKTHSDYRFPKTVYTVVVATGATSPRNRHIPPFSVGTCQMDVVNESGQPLGVYPHRLLFLNPRIRNDRTPESVRGWLELIDDSLDEQVDETLYTPPVFQKIIDEIKRDKVTPQELARIKDEAVTERYVQESFEEGRRAREREIAQVMLTQGIEPATIVATTGLSLEEIEKLGDEHS
jgi:hypothetical protein